MGEHSQTVIQVMLEDIDFIYKCTNAFIFDNSIGIRLKKKDTRKNSAEANTINKEKLSEGGSGSNSDGDEKIGNDNGKSDEIKEKNDDQ